MIDLYNTAVQARNGASGFYNDNIRVDTPSGPVIVRIPITGADTMDLRIWPEQDVLAALAPHVSHVPRLLYASPEPPFQVHEFIAGDVLDHIAPRGTRVPPAVLEDVVDLFAQLTTVPLDRLPELPPSWPADADTTAFARQLSDVTEQVYDSFRKPYHSLFTALGIPEDPLAPVLAGWPELTPRPFTLVHADVHRKNMIFRDGHVVFLDWELALQGDPVYELAVHFHKMSYYNDERQAVLDGWVKNMPARYTQGWERDLDIYLTHERVKSAIVDTVRYTQLIAGGRLSASEEDQLIGKLTGKLNAAGAKWKWSDTVSTAYVETRVRQHGRACKPPTV
ncbi:aminoglycoside phosphotransferase family protein [Planotetraspora sp. A-T 1434]|uniref:phosphotransferase family protein n=1 Tax=Planotetraspora sp. A-T 1434 TaxID=2979219 RepID=UPI0021C14B9C|nr:aminoglycoside phosphotransferase family protein [Planotetraspora sp. A-T 1434]MCT9934961.1 aminoglycoside phosphotransferase family protein [Planotetraspora sp. A-T 1434]